MIPESLLSAYYDWCAAENMMLAVGFLRGEQTPKATGDGPVTNMLLVQWQTQVTHDLCTQEVLADQ